MQQMDLDLPEQHPVLYDSDATLRRKKSSYRLERAGTSLAERYVRTFHFTHTDVTGQNL